MKKFLSIFLLFVILFSCVSCVGNFDNKPSEPTTNSTTTEATTTTESTTTSDQTSSTTDDTYSPKHYEIELNMENFETYFTCTVENALVGGKIYTNGKHTISGVLSYAYYENVVVTFVEKDIKNKQYRVPLNAAGDAVFLSYLYDGTYSIERVSGKVIFNI